MSALCAALKCQTSLLHRLEDPLGVFFKLGYYYMDYYILPTKFLQVSASFYKFLQEFTNLPIYQSTNLHLFSTV